MHIVRTVIRVCLVFDIFVLLAYDLPSTCSQHCDATAIEGSLHRTSDRKRIADISLTPRRCALTAAVQVDKCAAETIWQSLAICHVTNYWGHSHCTVHRLTLNLESLGKRNILPMYLKQSSRSVPSATVHKGLVTPLSLEHRHLSLHQRHDQRSSPQIQTAHLSAFYFPVSVFRGR